MKRGNQGYGEELAREVLSSTDVVAPKPSWLANLVDPVVRRPHERRQLGYDLTGIFREQQAAELAAMLEDAAAVAREKGVDAAAQRLIDRILPPIEQSAPTSGAP